MKIKDTYLKLSRKHRRQMLEAMRAEANQRPKALCPIPERCRPAGSDLEQRGWTRKKAYVSRTHLVQEFHHANGCIRLSVNRCAIDPLTGDWQEVRGWDELFEIKNQLYPDRQAVEVFPPVGELVNVANIRHLWILPEPIGDIDLRSFAD